MEIIVKNKFSLGDTIWVCSVFNPLKQKGDYMITGKVERIIPKTARERDSLLDDDTYYGIRVRSNEIKYFAECVCHSTPEKARAMPTLLVEI